MQWTSRPLKRLLGNAAIYLAVVIVSATAIWLLSADARQEVDALAVANADSTQWSLAQSEVEFLSFANAARAVIAGDAEPEEARRRFDVMYSRMQTLKVAPAFAEVRERDAVADALSRVDEFLALAVPVIDASDADLRAKMPELVAAFPGLQKDLRSISLSGVAVFSRKSETQRAAVSGALTDLALISFGLLALLLAVVGGLLIINRESQRQTSEIALTQSRLQAIISTSLDAILVAGKDGRVLDFNGAAEGVFGYSREEAIGADMAALIVPDHMRDAHNAGMECYRSTGEKRVVGSGLLKLEAKRKDGTVFPVELSINSAESEEGEIFVSYLRDISQRVANETELVEARDKALAGEKAKADLLAVMSHEMRTPLNGVLGTLELLSGTELDDRQRKFVSVMDSSGKLLLEHVNNVLDVSRVDAGMADVAQNAFDVVALAEDSLEGLRAQATKRGNSLSINVVGPPIGRVLGDAKRLRQILFNLVGNAIKFTENGSVTLELEAGTNDETVEFRVIDTGIGIAEQDLARIFEDFVTLDASYQREVEGTGLGLGIVKRLVHMLGGEIGVESEQGDGSVFWFRLALPRANERRTTQSRTSAASNDVEGSLSVLVVEDNEINRMVAREMLEQAGCAVTEAVDGQDGVRTANAQEFDLILMDISMPKVDGTAATVTIKSGNGPNTSTPIIALTAHALPGDVVRFREAGMADVITKPLSSDRLRAVLAEYHSAAPGIEAPQEASSIDDMIGALGAERTEVLWMRAVEQLSSGLVELEMASGDEGACDQVKSIAHKLAGSAALFGMDEVQSSLTEIELNAADMTPERISSVVANLRKLLESKLPGST